MKRGIPIVIVVALLCVAAVLLFGYRSQTPPSTIPPAPPGNFKWYRGSQGSSAVFFFALPDRFKLDLKGLPYEYAFTSGESETLAISFAGYPTEGVKETMERAIGSTPQGHLVTTEVGARFGWKEVASRGPRILIGIWSSKGMYASVDVRTSREGQQLEDEIVAIGRSLLSLGDEKQSAGIASKLGKVQVLPKLRD